MTHAQVMDLGPWKRARGLNDSHHPQHPHDAHDADEVGGRAPSLRAAIVLKHGLAGVRRAMRTYGFQRNVHVAKLVGARGREPSPGFGNEQSKDSGINHTLLESKSCVIIRLKRIIKN